MLAIIENSVPTTDAFGATVCNFLEHARAVATGEAEGDLFTWFLAAEYQWEMETAGSWLVESPDSRLSASEKRVLGHFLKPMPALRQSIQVARRAAAQRADASLSAEWTDWLELAGLPAWNDFTVRTVILLSQLGEPARNDDHYDVRA
ncbi:MAG: hypothetical protein ABI386_04055 [Rhodanobacter sp.]